MAASLTATHLNSFGTVMVHGVSQVLIGAEMAAGFEIGVIAAIMTWPTVSC